MGNTRTHMAIWGPVTTVQASTKSSSEVHREPPNNVMLKPGLMDHLKETDVTHRVEGLGDIHRDCYCATRRLPHVESLGHP